jgi:diacylglycerol O-acyltransferase / wax synthase
MTDTQTKTRTQFIAPLDAGWLWLESPTNHMHGSVVAIFSKPAGAGSDYVASIVRDMRGFTVPTPPFDRRLDRRLRGRLWPTWRIVEEIDPDYHLRHIHVPAPGGPEEFHALISQLQGVALDHKHPLWTIDVIEGLEGDRFAVFGKMHHALADGVAALAIVGQWLSEDPDERGMPPIWAYRRPKRKGRKRAPQKRTPPNPLGALTATVNAARYAVAGVSARPWTAPRSVLNKPISAGRRVATASYELDRFRVVAERGGGTINDVVLAVCAGALRRYLGDSEQLPGRPLVTNIPVSVRKDSGAAGNAISWAMISLATDISDPSQRFHAIREGTVKAKQRLSGMSAGTIDTYTLMAVTPILVEQVTRAGGHTPPQFNVPISNVPGPRNRMYLNGAPMQEIQALTVIYGGQALNVVTLSYAERLDFAFTACADVLADVDRLADACGEALEELEAVL